MVLSLFVVLSVFLTSDGGALGIDDDIIEEPPIENLLVEGGEESPCTKTYLPGTVLFSQKTAQQLVASPKFLKPYIKSISNKRYWGLASNLRLKKSDRPQDPYILELKIPKGAINPGNRHAPRGGAGYHWTPKLPENTQSACLSYAVWFPGNYDFVKGGKLPGIFGGMGPSGGKKVTGKNGFSTRYMWRKGGRGEVYAYIIGNKKRGISIDRGAWRFKRGGWTRLAQEVILNTPGQENGRVRVWVNDELVIDRSGLVYRSVQDVTISGVMAHVFFGGKDPSWASTRDTIVRMTPFDLRWRRGAQESAGEPGAVR